MSEIKRCVFDTDELVKVPEPSTPVVLKSGGPIMELESVEGGSAMCRWTGLDGKLCRVVLPLVCLYRCEKFK